MTSRMVMKTEPQAHLEDKKKEHAFVNRKVIVSRQTVQSGGRLEICIRGMEMMTD